jgi:hypothetical protein
MYLHHESNERGSGGPSSNCRTGCATICRQAAA